MFRCLVLGSFILSTAALIPVSTAHALGRCKSADVAPGAATCKCEVQGPNATCAAVGTVAICTSDTHEEICAWITFSGGSTKCVCTTDADRDQVLYESQSESGDLGSR